MKNQTRTIIAIAVAFVGIIIGATVLILMQRENSDIPAESTAATTDAEESGSSGSVPSEESSTPTGETEETSAQGETLPPVTNAPQTDKIVSLILGQWTSVSAYRTSNGEIVDLNSLYGSGYKTYGGSLIFNENNTFSLNIGVTNNGDANNGKYSCGEDSVSVTYNNDRDDTFQLIFNSGGEVECILVPQKDVTVIFERQ